MVQTDENTPRKESTNPKGTHELAGYRSYACSGPQTTQSGGGGQPNDGPRVKQLAEQIYMFSNDHGEIKRYFNARPETEDEKVGVYPWCSAKTECDLQDNGQIVTAYRKEEHPTLVSLAHKNPSGRDIWKNLHDTWRTFRLRFDQRNMQLVDSFEETTSRGWRYSQVARLVCLPVDTPAYVRPTR